MDKLKKHLQEAWQRMEETNNTKVLYRGLEKEFDSEYDLDSTDAVSGYSTWTDNPELARRYAGKGGYVYKLELPLSEMGDEYIDEDGERALFFNNEKKAGLDGISGDEYLVYHHHDLFDINSIILFEGPTNDRSSLESYINTIKK